MPRGKELEQLPMAQIAPGAGEDAASTNREILTSTVDENGPFPSAVKNTKKKEQV